MCFKKPKLPPKTADEIQLEQELAAQRRQRREELAGELRLSKEQETEAALARALGFVGNRSLIAGARGGAGFMGAGSGRVVGSRSGGSGARSIRPSAPATAGGTGGGLAGGAGRSAPTGSTGGGGRPPVYYGNTLIP